MIVNVYVTIDPRGDRPYVSTVPPSPSLDRRGGEVKVYLYELWVPDAVPVDIVYDQDHQQPPKEV